jgi:hypothetical protein
MRFELTTPTLARLESWFPVPVPGFPIARQGSLRPCLSGILRTISLPIVRHGFLPAASPMPPRHWGHKPGKKFGNGGNGQAHKTKRRWHRSGSGAGCLRLGWRTSGLRPASETVRGQDLRLVARSRSASKAIFAFNAASILRSASSSLAPSNTTEQPRHRSQIRGPLQSGDDITVKDASSVSTHGKIRKGNAAGL